MIEVTPQSNASSRRHSGYDRPHTPIAGSPRVADFLSKWIPSGYADHRELPASGAPRNTVMLLLALSLFAQKFLDPDKRDFRLHPESARTGDGLCSSISRRAREAHLIR